MGLLMTHAMMYGVPAFLTGTVTGTAGLLYVQQYYKDNSAQLPIRMGPSNSALVAAVVMGVFMPALAALGPIQAALGKTLREGLDTQRAKTNAVVLNVERSGSDRVSAPQLIVGSLLTASGARSSPPLRPPPPTFRPPLPLWRPS